MNVCRDIAQGFLFASVAVVFFRGTAAAVPELSQTGSTSKPTVYVSDFTLDVLPAGADRNTLPAVPPESGAKIEEEARKQASHLVDRMAANLVLSLQKAGYTAIRLKPGDPRPDAGIRIRGLFAEVDKENHWRRAVIRSGSDSGKVQALVSVADLAKPDQTLYEIARLPGNANKPGAVITLSPYVPLAKFDLDKDAPEDAFQKTATRIVNDLTALLNANPTAGSPQ